MNSFELRFDIIEGNIVIDKDFFRTREAQYKEVFTELDFLGWYTTGSAPNISDVNVHKQMCEINESPIFCKMDPSMKPSEKLPLSVFESVLGGAALTLFVELPFRLATEEAERVGVDHVARISAADSAAVSAVTKQLWAQHGAVKMLHSRLLLLTEYLSSVQAGDLPPDPDVLRDIASLTHRLPVTEHEEFQRDFHVQCNDITLMAYLGALTKTCGSLHQLVNKLNIIHDRHGPGTIRRGRGLLM